MQNLNLKTNSGFKFYTKKSIKNSNTFENFLLNDDTSFNKIISEFCEKEVNAKILVIVTNVRQFDQQEVKNNTDYVKHWDKFENEQNWIVVTIVREAKNSFSLFVIHDTNKIKKKLIDGIKNDLVSLFRGLNGKVTLLPDYGYETGCKSFSLAFKNAEYIFNQFATRQNDRNYFTKNEEAIEFDKLIVENCIESVQMKNELQVVVYSLKNLINYDLKLSKGQLKSQDFIFLNDVFAIKSVAEIIAEKFLNNRSFKVDGNDEIDIEKEILKCFSDITDFSNRDYLKIFENSSAILKYLEDSLKNEACIKKIKEYDSILEENCINDKIRKGLFNALKTRLETLVLCGKLNKKLLKFEHFDDYFKYFCNIDRDKLIDQYGKLTKKLNSIKLDGTPNKQELIMKTYAEFDDLTDEGKKLNKRIGYNSMKLKFLDDLLNEADSHVIKLIELFPHYVQTNTNQKIDKQTYELFLYLTHRKELLNENLALNLLKLIKYCNGINDLNRIGDIFSVISEKSVNNVIQFCYLENYENGNYENISLFNYFERIIVSDDITEDAKRDNVVFVLYHLLCSNSISDAASKYKFLIELELCCKSEKNDDVFIKNCGQVSAYGLKLPFRCLKRLSERLERNEVKQLILKLLDANQQTLPDLIIQRFQANINLYDPDLSVSKALFLNSNYKSFYQHFLNNTIITNINQENLNNFLDIIDISIEQEYKLPDKVVDFLKTLSKENKYALNLFKKFNVNVPTVKVDVVRTVIENTNIRHEERIKAISDLTINQIDLKTVILFQNLIKFDEKLSREAFKKLIYIVQAKEDFIANIDLKLIIDYAVNQNEDLTPLLLIIRNNLGKLSNLDNLISFVLVNLIDSTNKNYKIFLDLFNFILKSNLSKEKLCNLLYLLYNYNHANDFGFKNLIIKTIHDKFKNSIDDKFKLVKELYKNSNVMSDKLNNEYLDLIENCMNNQIYIPVFHLKILFELFKFDHIDRSRLSDLLIGINKSQSDDFKLLPDLINVMELIQKPTDGKESNMKINYLFYEISKNNLEFGSVLLNHLIENFTTENKKSIQTRTEAVDKNENDLMLLLFIKNLSCLLGDNYSLPEQVYAKLNTNLERPEIDYSSLIVIEILLIRSRVNLAEIPDQLFDRIKQLVIKYDCSSSKTVPISVLKRFSYEILETKFDKTFDGKFIVDYCNMITERLNKLCNDTMFLELIKKYFNSNKLNKSFRFLVALNNFVFKWLNENTIVILLHLFTHFDEKYWLVQILTVDLLNSIQSNIEVDDFDLKKFQQSMEEFSKNSNNIDKIEKLLKLIIDKQELYDFDLNFLNDLLVFFNYDQNIDFALQSGDLKPNELFLRWLFNYKNIQNDYLLSHFVTFKPTLVERFLDKFDGCNHDLFVEFFKKLDQFQSLLGNDGYTERKKLFSYALINFKSKNFEKSLKEMDFFVLKSLLIQKLKENTVLIEKIHFELKKLLDNNWKFNSVLSIINSLKLDETLFNVFEIIHEYNLKEYNKNIKNESLIDILEDLKIKFETKLEKIHDLAIYNTFEGSFVKSPKDLIEEMKNLNKGLNLNYLSSSIWNDFQKVNHIFANQISMVLTEKKKYIKDWNDNDVISWSNKFKSIEAKSRSTFVHEQLAVIKRACELYNKFPLRDVQLMSVLILLNKNDSKGRLCQINTGEGKTTIVAVLALMKLFQGINYVDIITSSPELARPHAEKQKKFFNLFGYTVEHNCRIGEERKNHLIKNDYKEKYEANVLYGTANDFQGDILRHEFNKLEIRHGRKFECAIVDEVDSMLVDGKNHIVMLSSQMPAMDFLEPILCVIWMQIKEAAKSIHEENGKAYYIQRSNGINENGKPIENVEDNAVEIETTKHDFLKTSTKNLLLKLLRHPDMVKEMSEIELKSSQEIKIPLHLRELVLENKLDLWIESAIQALFFYEKDKHYVITSKGKIAPVDASNTGVVQENMHWTKGLHQFLQIKHGAKIIPESIITNYISNVAFFKRYPNTELFGLTGTLGGDKSCNLLNKVYNVDSVIIPPFKKKQFHLMKPIVLKSNRYTKENWLECIVNNCLNKLICQRAVLIITQYIDEAVRIKELISSKLENDDGSYYKRIKDKIKIKLYKTEEDSKVTEEDLDSYEIIIATNIAGRGTDIKPTLRVEKNGGLHVCITFLPVNQRVEFQNLGRTSRTGNKGTGQFIIFKKLDVDSTSNDYDDYFFDSLIEVRNLIEEENLRNAEKEIEKVLKKDKIFEDFCKLLKEIECKDYVSKAVEERFGIWLLLKEKAMKEKPNECFEKFKNEILNDHQNNKLIKNPFFHTSIGNKYLDNKKYLEAIDEYTKAINMDSYFQVNSFYNRAMCILLKYGNDCHNNKNEIDKAVEDLKQAKLIVEENLKPMLAIFQYASKSEVISEQVSHKLNLYGTQLNTIEAAIGVGEGKVDEEIKMLNDQLEKQDVKAEDKEKIKKQIDSLKENKCTREKGVIGLSFSNNSDLKCERIEIKKSLPEDEDVSLYEDEIEIYINNGYAGIFQIKELKPINWWSVAAVTALGLAQIVAGAALAVFTLGAGSQFGIGLVISGVGDLVTAVKSGIINRDFSWTEYGIQKAIDLVVSIVCLGFSGLKDVAYTTIRGTTFLVKGAVTVAIKEGWKLAAKTIAINLAKGIAKNACYYLSDLAVNKKLIPAIKQKINELVYEPLRSKLVNNEMVKKMLELDLKFGNMKYEALIKNKAIEILFPNNEKENRLLRIAKGVGVGILSQKVKGFQDAMLLYNSLEAIDEIANVLPNLLNKLNNEIQKLYEDNKIDEKHQKCVVSKGSNDFDAVHQDDDRQNSYSSESNINHSNLDFDSDNDIHLNKLNQEQEQVRIKRKKDISIDSLSEKIAINVSNKLSGIIEGKLINPLTHKAIDCGINKLSKTFDDELNKEIGLYQADRRIKFSKEAPSHVTNEFKNKHKEQEYVEEAKNIIDDVKNDGEAGLHHLGYLSDELDRPIVVLDKNGKVKEIIGEGKSGTALKVQYHPPNETNPTGHWTLENGKEPINNTNTGANNCLFNVLAEQTGHDPNELRSKLADRMEANINTLANQVSDIRTLEIYKFSALCMGGSKLKANGDFEIELDDVNAIIKYVNSPAYNKRQKKLKEHALIDCKDQNGNKVDIARHHLIPESQIRKDFKDFVNNSSPAVLKAEMEAFINHPNSLFEKHCLMRALNLKNPGDQSVNYPLFAQTFAITVSWHTNNIQIGPIPGLRPNDPSNKLNTNVTYANGVPLDLEVMNNIQNNIVQNYLNLSQSDKLINGNNILRTLKSLPNNAQNKGWDAVNARGKTMYQANQNLGSQTRDYQIKSKNDTRHTTVNDFKIHP